MPANLLAITELTFVQIQLFYRHSSLVLSKERWNLNMKFYKYMIEKLQGNNLEQDWIRVLGDLFVSEYTAADHLNGRSRNSDGILAMNGFYGPSRLIWVILKKAHEVSWRRDNLSGYLQELSHMLQVEHKLLWVPFKIRKNLETAKQLM